MSPSTSPSPVIKRTKVTYGRRKDSNTGVRALDADSGAPSLIASLFAARKPRLATPENDEVQDSDGHDVPETSMLTGAGNDSGEAEDDDGDDDGDKRSFQFAFKKHLVEIDQMEDDELKHVSGANDEQDDDENNHAMNVDKDGSHSTHHGSDIPTSPAAEPLPEHEDLFCGTLSSLTQSSLQLSSPEAAPVKRPSRAHARQIIHDSSDEEPAPPAEASSPRTSPQNPLGSPKGRTSTPPTTDDEMLPTRLTAKGKGKERARSVATSLFDDDEEEVSRANTSRKGSKAADGRKGKGKEKAKKDKRLTKKEIAEAKRESARLAADRRTSIKSSTVTKPMSEFLTNLKPTAPVRPPPAPKQVGISSDPIQQFSSPSTHPHAHTPAPPSPVAVHSAVPVAPMVISPFRPTGLLGAIPDATSDDDEEAMPSMRDILKRDQAKRELQQRKQLALERRAVMAHSDDDELEIVAADLQEEAQDRKGRPRQSEVHKRQLELALGRSGARAVSESPEKQRTKNMGVDALKSAGRSTFSVANEVKTRGGQKAGLKRAELDRILLERAEKQRAEEVRKKEEEYVKRGGRIKEGVLEEKDVGEWLEKGLKVAKKRERGMEEDSDEEDGDWMPDEQERGSASPVPDETRVEDDEDEGETMHVDRDDAEVDNGPEDDEKNPFAPPRLKAHRRSTARPRAVLDSDAESDAENPGIPFSPTATARKAPNVSASVPTTDAENENENETDKENVENRMFDRGEDKENKAVVRHALGERPTQPLRQESSLFGLAEDVQRRSSMSPSEAGVDVSDSARRPLGELPDEADDPFAFTPAKRTGGEAQSVLARLRSPLLPSPTPAFGTRAKGKAGGFSQFFDEEGGAEQKGERPQPMKLQSGFSQFFGEEDVIAVKENDAVPQPAALQGGFSQLFESGTAAATQGPKPMQLGGLTQAFEETQNNSGFDSMRKVDLSLTFKTQLLQPALEVDESLREKAEQIFEKEQEYLVEAANRPAKQQQKRELYVNENGFLTQTRPDVSTPELYRPSPSQYPNFLKTQRTQQSAAGLTQTQARRQPLGTLAFSDEMETPSQRPMQRLRHRGERDGYDSSPSPSPSPSPSRALQRNAYDALMRGASKDKGKEKEKLGRSEFVDADAVESDEDDAFGFGGVRKRPGQDDEEEGEGDGDDPTLEGLVDDAPMSDAAVAEALVREKVKEHQEEDDAALEKQAKDVAEGRYRVKRRNHGVGLDDSESEDDDDEARRVRRAAKKRRIDGDNLEDLAKDAATRPFYEAYQVGHADDFAEFAHLNQDTAMADADAEEEEDGEEGAGREIAASTVREKLRELARDGKEHTPMDPTDVSWLEREDEDDALSSLKFREIEGGGRRLTRRGPGHAESDGILRRGQQLSESDRVRMASWLKEESSSRIAGPGHGGAGSSVTGLGRAKKAVGSRTGGGARGVAREASAPAVRKLGKAASVLAVVAERRGKFGN